MKMILDFRFWILDCPACQPQAQAKRSPCQAGAKRSQCQAGAKRSRLQAGAERSAAPGLFIAFLFTLLLLPACHTERVTTSDGWPLPPQPRAAPQPPSTLRADRMFFTVGSRPDDTNNNGFPDSIVASVALFSSQHPTALRQDGAFIFSMYRQGEYGSPDSKPMATWRMEGDKVINAQAQTLAGPCYLFQLSLLELGTDRLPLERTDLVCRFESADQNVLPVQCDGVRTIQIGRRLASNQ